MRLSQYFIPEIRENPREAEIISHRYMLRAGMIRQTSAGIYSWLPIGLKVLNNIADIVRKEQNKMGALEMIMPTIQPADIWIKSGRYQNYGKQMLKIQDRKKQDMLYGPTNEEMITEICKNALQSYKQLPINLYQIQWKFRDEIRPRFGVMRGREFLMKDGYSFDIDAKSAIKSYNKNYISYLKIFAKLGLTAIPVLADTGEIGGSLSHEFVVLAKTGESNIFFHKDIVHDLQKTYKADYQDDLSEIIRKATEKYANNDEKHQPLLFQKIPEDKQITSKCIEVGHLFYFADKYSKPLECFVNSKDGRPVTLHSGSYGIGISRLVAAIIEAKHDEKGIIWPESVAPFDAIILNLKNSDHKITNIAQEIYQKMLDNNIDVLYDDTNENAGAKFNRADLIGIPYQIIVGNNAVKDNCVEIKRRADGKIQKLSLQETINFIAQNVKNKDE